MERSSNTHCNFWCIVKGMEWVSVHADQPERDRYQTLESGRILFFDRTPFELSEPDKQFLRGIQQQGSSYHKNIAYRPARDQLTGVNKASATDRARLHRVLQAYSRIVTAFLRGFLPRYMGGCRLDYASFRPYEEEGRDLPINKRNDLLHIDAFPTRPTCGDLILRIFTNINPAQPRVWLTTDPFPALAPKYAVAAGLPGFAREPNPLVRVLRAIGPGRRRSPYDRFMLRFHSWLKQNEEFQRTCPKYRLEFPGESTWIVFTDLVPHAVLSGRYALEQTFIVKRESLLASERSPIAILESIAQCRLAGA